ncbi:hypothetical protein GIB67_039010 [Kingdonia uniflora]|uniref:DUF4283 domain-containing protein n=1 Tax=Kingdonia uniflora TaxID=39325 RepID=A0A7J7LKR2_9MAGN|nr:hypothetical protein GIB67_039010 [Kingdonia uniflora]
MLVEGKPHILGAGTLANQLLAYKNIVMELLKEKAKLFQEKESLEAKLEKLKLEAGLANKVVIREVKKAWEMEKRKEVDGGETCQGPRRDTEEEVPEVAAPVLLEGNSPKDVLDNLIAGLPVKDASVKLVVARSEALRKWNLSGNCQFILLGKGYFTILLDNEADKIRIWGGRPWHIYSQLLRVNIWTPDFDINKQKNTHAMVWVKFPGLGSEYWEEDVLMSIARTVGNPVQVDNNTLCRNTRFYASVFVDVDFSKTISSKIMIEREGFEDVVKEIEQEKVIKKEADKELKKKRQNQKKPIVDITPLNNEQIPVHKTYKGVVEIWDSTIRLWDGSNNLKEVDKEASLVNKSWEDMAEGGSTRQNTEGVEVEDCSESESHSSDYSSYINKGYTEEIVYQTQDAEEWSNVMSRKNIILNKSKASSKLAKKQQTRRQTNRRL